MLKPLEEHLRQEREDSSLSNLSMDFFFQLQEHLAALQSQNDPISEKNRQLLQEGLEELVNLRAEKILKGCRRNMLSAESKLAECAGTFQKFKKDVLESLLQKDSTAQKVTVLQDIPQFYGPEMEVLGPYQQGDVVLLDKTIATLLKGKGLIELADEPEKNEMVM